MTVWFWFIHGEVSDHERWRWLGLLQYEPCLYPEVSLLEELGGNLVLNDQCNLEPQRLKAVLRPGYLQYHLHWQTLRQEGQVGAAQKRLPVPAETKL